MLAFQVSNDRMKNLTSRYLAVRHGDYVVSASFGRVWKKKRKNAMFRGTVTLQGGMLW